MLSCFLSDGAAVVQLGELQTAHLRLTVESEALAERDRVAAFDKAALEVAVEELKASLTTAQSELATARDEVTELNARVVVAEEVMRPRGE